MGTAKDGSFGDGKVWMKREKKRVVWWERRLQTGEDGRDSRGSKSNEGEETIRSGRRSTGSRLEVWGRGKWLRGSVAASCWVINRKWRDK